MGPERPATERTILDAWAASPPRIPVLVGASGSGRTTLLLRIADRLGAGRCQFIDAERAASTPEAFWTAVETSSPYAVSHGSLAARGDHSARAAFDSLRSFFQQARGGDGRVATFLFDELLELRAFSSFPGLRGALPELVEALADSPNRFAIATRYGNRAQRLVQKHGARFALVHLPPLSVAEVAAALSQAGVNRESTEYGELTRLVHVLTVGRPAYVGALAKALAATGGGDPVAVLAAQLGVGEPLCQTCRLACEIRLAGARGHGSLKAILQVLAAEEPLTLTAIANRLGRTPGSTRDYLSWLEDVDLIRVDRKRYSFSDPLLRVWVRLHARPMPPAKADLAREAHEYAVSRLPFLEATTPAPKPPRPVRRPVVQTRTRSIIEID